MKGCPYDNAVAETTYKIIKTEFVKQHKFENLDQLTIELADYVNWFTTLYPNAGEPPVCLHW